MRFRNQVAVVTGAASGIGRATAIRLAQEAASVVVVDIDRDGGRATERCIRDVGGEAVFVPTDVTSPADVEALVRVAGERFGDDSHGRVDILVNAAGVIRYGPMPEQTEEDWDLTLNVCLKGTFLCSKAVIPLMMRRRDGVIINVSSSGARLFPAAYPAYVAAKMGVLGLTQAMARGLREHGIAVVAVCPDLVDTPTGRKSFAEQLGRDPGAEDVAEMLRPEQVAGVIANLADPEMRFASSTVVDVRAF